MNLELYHYWRSSCSWRVRWALRLKDIPCKLISVDLLKHEQKEPWFQKLSPTGLIPVLKIHDDYLYESLAILEYLDEKYPHEKLLPENLVQRTAVRSFSLQIASGIQPLQNLEVLKYVSSETSEQQRFAAHWIHRGMIKIEQLLLKIPSGSFCFGGQLSLADICLIPQVYNAKRFGLNLADYPRAAAIYHHCFTLEDCKLSSPEYQVDAPAEFRLK